MFMYMIQNPTDTHIVKSAVLRKKLYLIKTTSVQSAPNVSPESNPLPVTNKKSTTLKREIRGLLETQLP